MTFYSPSSAQMFLPTAQYTTTTAGPGVFFASPSLGGGVGGGGALCQTPPLSPSASPLAQPSSPSSSLGRYGPCFNRSASVVLGIILVGCGCASIAGATMVLVFFARYDHVGTGYWCGAMFVSAGGLAIAAGHHRTDCLIVTTCVTSALTVVFGVAQLTLSTFALLHDVTRWECPIWKCRSYEEPPYDCHCFSWVHGAVVANSLLVGAGALATVSGLSVFISCLRTICCNRHEQKMLPAQYIPVWAQAVQQIQSDTGTIHKTVSIPVQVQCSRTSVSIDPSPGGDIFQNAISRNLVQENL